MFKKVNKRKIRHKRIRAKIFGTAVRPRLNVFRSHRHIYAQLIDDENGKTLVAFSDLKLPQKKYSNIKTDAGKILSRKIALAFAVGEKTAELAIAKKIEKVVFDKGGYKYHGRVKALADGARKGGLIF